ncbi:hypothetical protein ACFSUS_26655 [Spirosoma soli]|uniref:Uncharacterized protein n=1 Tax=Spirosoma soli TaxID=1770529 RepID=A0ABW5MDF2_9BACT
MILSPAKTVILVWLLSACSTTKPNYFSNSSGGYCEPALTYTYNDTFRPQTVLPADTSLTNHFSRHDLLMANATGILPLLQELSQPQGKTTPEARLERLTKIQQVQSRLALASTEIASLAAELDCEGERADQLATYLEQKDQRRIRNLTLFSVIIGAATTVATAFIQTDNANKTIGIGGGLLSAGLGGAAAFSSNKTVSFAHKRNLLADIWSQSDQSVAYSPFIWYVLNEKVFSNSGQTSVRYNIRRRWQEYVLKKASIEKQQLYFGTGGLYQADDLRTRANMLNQLQSSVRSINQDLQSLLTRLTIVFK